MLKQMRLRNLTVFPDADLQFAKHLNVMVGENGAGKTHLLKMAYSVMATSHDEGKKRNPSAPTKGWMQGALADKLVNVFRAETLGRLARRRQGRHKCEISLSFSNSALDLGFGFATNSKSEVVLDKVPLAWLEASPAYLPTRELLTIFPNFVSVYESHYLEFEETWRDTCLLLGAPLHKGPRQQHVRELLAPLEDAMGGSIELDRNGRFYLNNASGRLEMPLVAEGVRKLGMLARLIASGTLLGQGYLFWDEPEANLNPVLIRHVARTVVELGKAGVQVFLATHSLFLLRELDMLVNENSKAKIEAQFFGLHKSDEGVSITQGESIYSIGTIAALDESLAQADRYLAFEG